MPRSSGGLTCTYDPPMGEEHDVREFSELLDLLRGMGGQFVEASVFLPWDDGRLPVAGFSGTLVAVGFNDFSRDPHWQVTWDETSETKVGPTELRIWERRFIRAELSFTGDPDEGLAEIDEPRGQNIFLKVHSEGWIVDLIGYV